MRRIYDLKAVVKTVMNKDVPTNHKIGILNQYGIKLVSSTHDQFRFQCTNPDERWYGKTIIARPTQPAN